jgi:hypothetical protein
MKSFGLRTRVAVFTALLAVGNVLAVQPSHAAGPPYALLRWTVLPTHPAQFSSRDAYAYNPDTGQTVVFGHETGASYSPAATWVFDGKDWIHKLPAHTPPVRIGATMAYDPILKRVVLFGGVPTTGSKADQILGDMWAWNGTDWSTVAALAFPPPRAYGVMQTTAAGVLLFGGAAKGTCAGGVVCAGPVADTWLFTGVTWMQLSPAASPPARWGHVMADSPDTHTTLLFGGRDATQVFRDTWSFDGTGWTRLGKVGAPGPSSGAAYDPTSKKIVTQADLYGAPSTAMWDGKTWSYQRLYPQPPVGAGLVYDSKAGVDLLFGAPANGGVITSVHMLNKPRVGLGGTLIGGPDSASPAPGRTDVVVQGADHSLFHKWSNGDLWSDWEWLGGQLTADPSIVSWGSGRLDVFVRGTDNALWHRAWDTAGWHAWESLGGVLTSAPDAASMGPGHVEVFVRGLDSAIWHRRLDGRGWHGWEPLGGVATSDPGAAALRDGSGRMDVVVRGTDNALWRRTYDGAGWGRWFSLGGAWDSAPDVAQGTTGVYVRAGDGLGHTTIGHDDGWTAQAGPVTDNPSAVGETPSFVRVFTRGDDGELYMTVDSTD